MICIHGQLKRQCATCDAADMRVLLNTPERTFNIRSMGKTLRVTAIFTAVDAANAYMAAHDEMAVVAEFDGFIFMADRYDRGEREREHSKTSYMPRLTGSEK